ADQFERGRPVDAHAALGGIHGLGDAEPERPQMAAERDGALPIDGGIEPGIGVRERIGDHVRRRVGDAVERRLRRGEVPRRLGGVGLKLAASDGKIERGHVCPLRSSSNYSVSPGLMLRSSAAWTILRRLHKSRYAAMRLEA